MCNIKIGYRKYEQKNKIQTARFVVKVKRKNREIQNTQPCVLVNQKINGQKAYKQVHEKRAAENQRSIGLIGEFLYYFLKINGLHVSRMN